MTSGATRRVLVTRAAEQSAATARRLRERGYEAVVAPLVRFERLPARITPDAQAILVTSQNGARALVAATDLRMTPILAVGDATADILREAGFADVRSANGNARALAILAKDSLDPERGLVLHARGADVRHSPLAGLESAGFRTGDAILYRSVPLVHLPPEATACDTALVYSLGSARRLLAAMLPDAALDIIAISDAALDPVRSAAFARGLYAAPHPSEDAMLAVLDALPKNSTTVRATSPR